MLKKIFHITADSSKSKGKISIWGFIFILLLSAITLFSPKAHVQCNNSVKENLYIFGKKKNHKFTVITNQTVPMAIYASAKNYINKNFKI